ncbi:MAG TPA: trimeric intracellular cation channel family protein [Pantanalinema sp.]
MVWEILNVIGTIAFATSGAIVAMEEDYDVIGVLFLGMTTSFGGGIIRDLLLGIPLSSFWAQTTLHYVAIASIAAIYLLPRRWIRRWMRLAMVLDAAGLAAFAIQGGLYAREAHLSHLAVVLAAIMTGTGGGIIRDVLAHRRPLVFQNTTLYVVWAMLAGAAIALGLPTTPLFLFGLLGLVCGLRIASVVLEWRLPLRRIV